MTTDTKAVARWGKDGVDYQLQKQAGGHFVMFTDHEQVVAELSREIGLSEMISDRLQCEIDSLRSALAAKSAEVEGFREVLAVIADMHAEKDSNEGYNEWGEADCFHQARDLAKAAMEKSNEHQDQ